MTTEPDEIVFTTQARTIKGIELPWERVERYGPQPNRWKPGEFFDAPPKGTILESGTVFIDESTLYEIAEQDDWAGAFGNSLIIGYHEKMALVKAGLAEDETRGGVHGTPKLRNLLGMDEDE